jgi:uncharacterized protein
MSSAIYDGRLTHVRRAPARNEFTYPLSLLLLDLDELPDLSRRLRLLGYDRRAPVAVLSRDHLGDPARDIRTNLLAYLDAHGIDLAGGSIRLLTNARTFGYVFNPVSFYWCNRADGSLACVVAEVHNTFGERFPYLLRAQGPERPQEPFRATAEKAFHVSPFMDLEGTYRFELSEPGRELVTRIVEERRGDRFFSAVFSGARRPLDDRALARMLVRQPFATAQVTGRIHWQALRLWRRGVPFHRKPPFDPETGSRAA